MFKYHINPDDTHCLTANILYQIDTKGFQSVLKLIETTNADSFDLFYGLYKFNRNSMDIIVKLKEAMDDVVGKLLEKEGKSVDTLDMKKSCL